MRLGYLEPEGLFTSNGLFKIRKKLSRKKFLQFPQFLAKSSCQRYPCPLIFGQASAIFKLNAFDTVFVQMRDGGSDRGTLAQGADMNNIQIEKLD